MPTLTGLWRHTDFLKLWTGQTLSALGSTITNLALPLTAALILHASAFEMGLLSTAATVPNLLFGLVAGVWADRVRRRPIMIGADISRALLLLSIPAAALFHLLTMGQLYAVLFLAGACTTFFDVANVSYLPSLVGRGHVVSANSRLVASASVATAVGPGVAGGLIQLFTAPTAIIVDALSVAVSAVLVLTIRSTESALIADNRRAGVWGEIADGLRPLYVDPLLRSIAVSSMIYLLFNGILMAVYVLYAIRHLGIMPGLLGVIFGMGGMGAAVGAVLARPLVRRLGAGSVMIVANLVGGLCTLLIPLADHPSSTAVLLLLAAQGGSQLMGAIFFIIQTSVRQVITPDNVRGRMNASYRFLTMGIIPIGSFLGGVLGGAIGLRATLVIAGVGLLLPTLWLFLSPVRAMHTVDFQEDC